MDILNLSGHFEFWFGLICRFIYIRQIRPNPGNINVKNRNEKLATASISRVDYTFNRVNVLSCGPSYVPVKGELVEVVTCQTGPRRG